MKYDYIKLKDAYERYAPFNPVDHVKTLCLKYKRNITEGVMLWIESGSIPLIKFEMILKMGQGKELIFFKPEILKCPIVEIKK